MASHRKPRLDESALAPIVEKVDSVHEIIREARNLPLEKIQPNPDQPRKTFDPDADDDLERSIKDLGIMEPLVVRPHDDGYQVICGERRYRAARELGLTTVPAIVRKADDLKALRMAYEENVQREDLHILDEAQFLQGLIDRGLVKNRKHLATSLGVTEARVSQKLTVLRLPDSVQEAFAGHTFLGELHARALSHLEDPRTLDRVLASIVARQLSGRQAEALVRRLTSRATTRPRARHIEFKDAVISERGTGYALRLPGLPPPDLADLLTELAQAIRGGKLHLPASARTKRSTH